jgi:hypothetical protein
LTALVLWEENEVLGARSSRPKIVKVDEATSDPAPPTRATSVFLKSSRDAYFYNSK